jgi:hypothetical protein
MLQIDHVGSMMDNDVRRNEQEGITVSPPTRSKGEQLIFKDHGLESFIVGVRPH